MGKFISYDEASKAVCDLGIRSAKDYAERYKEAMIDLPSNPHSTYYSAWKKNGGWKGFLSFEEKNTC
jgi:Integrase repeat unit